MALMGDGKPPRGRVARLVRLGGLGRGLAWDLVRTAGSLGAGSERGPAAETFHRRAAAHLRDILGGMKGLPMKVGQLMSYVDDFLPAAHREIYRETLRELQVMAAPMSFRAVREIIREELGEKAETLIARIDEEPLAAASIGQVHRGALRDGTLVAIKVQYPGIADAIKGDLKNLDTLRAALSLVLPKLEVEQGLADITARLREECDYGCELCNQEEFLERWRGDAEVVVPRVFPELSRDRVLTSELVTGATFAELRAREPAERNRVARILFRFVFRSLYRYQMFNADPHPGNYVFLEDGRVAFLDFGCVQRYDAETIAAFREVRRLVMSGEAGQPLRDAMVLAYGLPPLDEEEWAFTIEYVRCCFEPVSARGPFRYDRSYGERLADLSLKGAFLFARKSLRKGLVNARREGFVFLNRLTYGFASILVALEAEGDWRGEIEKVDAEVAASARPA